VRLAGQDPDEGDVTKGALRNILHVDDEPDIREVVQLSLALMDGWNVQSVGSGREAFSVLREAAPDLVLLDYMMPEMDGTAILAALQADPATRHIPVVFMTAKSMPVEVAKLVAAGAAAVIAKPFDPLKLGHQLLDIWHSESADDC
jgi:two-component system OmpR family response regulator